MASPLLALGAMAAGGALDAISGAGAAKDQREMLKQVLRQMRELRGASRVAGGQALQARRRGLGAIRRGYGDALAETTRLGEASEMDARAIAEQQFGAAQQDLLSRGQFVPDHLGVSRLGIGDSLARTLAAINERVAGQRGGLMAQRGHAVAGAFGDIAGQIDSNFDRTASLTQSMLGFQASQQPYAQPVGRELGWIGAGLSMLDWGGEETPAVNPVKAALKPKSPWTGWGAQ